MVRLDQSLAPVIGKRSSDALAKAFGYTSVRDLLTHYPRRLDDRGQLTDISRLREGEQATVLARVESVRQARFRPRGGGREMNRTEVVLTDGVTRISATFFGTAWRSKQLAPGTVAYVSGKVGSFRGTRQLTQPIVDVLGAGASVESLDDDDELRRWWPVYPATSALSSMAITRCVETVLSVLDPVPDPLPASVRDAQSVIDFDTALRTIHHPDGPGEYALATRRLRFDEAFILQAALVQRRAEAHARPAVARPGSPGGLLDAFDGRLPFTLTDGQRDVGDQIADDLALPHPMQRLLQGEVGSGKTVVALRAMVQVVDAGGQAALLAPTEVLAAQHHRGIVMLLGDLAEQGMLGGSELGTRVALLTGSTSAATRRDLRAGLLDNTIGILVGTHALLEQSVEFADLGLVVIDEQHRFGVEQRAALTEKGGAAAPHVLVMTATPIPRTVAMTVFGDLDTSVLRELPLGRSPIQTTVVPAEQPAWLDRAWRRVREEVAAGHQAYVVCPRIGGDPEDGMTEPAEDPDAPPARAPLAVADVAARLAEGPLAGLRLEVLHGRLPSDDKDRLMRAFGRGEIDVLVATTVVEVGVDVPNATVMVLMDADRFGVSSLHQLRGRIGRGSAPGLCLLVTESAEGTPARERLEAVAATTDGFALAQLDLETRREGDVLGALQSGRRSSLRLLSVLRDADVIAAAREAAAAIVAADPGLLSEPALASEIARLLADDRTEYLEKA
jgi:ATP-dependent DNA helicase RecG